MRVHKLSSMILAGAVVLAVGMAQATITIPTVPVGNPFNANDNTGYGKVDYNYNIGTYEVTNTQYTSFLNAVDTAGTNPNGIYSLYMGSNVTGGIMNDGTSGTKYYTKPNMGDMPVNYVSFWDACRFANWLHNGQGAVSTETGAYTLTPTGIANNTITRNTDWKWAVASENEWYKAAYYDPNKDGTGGYWLYPTGTNIEPYSAKPPGSGTPDQTNTANFRKDDGLVNGYDDGFAVTGSPNFNPATENYLTDVGAYTESKSSYGTFDQAGNVWEWNEAIIPPTDISGSSRGIRGGSWANASSAFVASYRYEGPDCYPSLELTDLGFRVASTAVPEPSTFLIFLGIGAISLLVYAWRRRRA